MNEQRFYAPRFEVRIAGVTLAADVTNQVVSVRYENNLDLADMFSLVLRNADNQLLDSALFDLGKTVELHMGYGHQLEPMMLGEITALEPAFPQNGPPTLKISGYDKSYKLRHNQSDRPAFLFMNDSLIAAAIALEAGLIPMVDPSPIVHLEPLKQTGSDMAFLKERAAANFFDVYVRWDKLYFQFPRPQSEAYVLRWGQNLSSFSPRISSTGLAGLQIIRGYNQELAQSIVAFALAVDLNLDNMLEKLGSAGLDLLLSLGRRVLYKQSVKSPLDAAVLARSILQQILEGLYEGEGSCIGLPELRAGGYVTIEGVGKRFSGVYRLRKVTHTIDDSGYHTEFEITQRSHSNFLGLLRKKLIEEPAPNQSERFYGVVVGEVINTIELLAVPPRLPLGSVQVRFPWLSETYLSGWAPCVTPNQGIFCPLKMGDQVLVAFEHGDLAKPIVLGSLWNAKQPPPATVAAPGLEKMVIRFKGSEITLDADGSVTISALTNLTLKANGLLTLDATKVDVNVKTIMDIK